MDEKEIIVDVITEEEIVNPNDAVQINNSGSFIHLGIACTLIQQGKKNPLTTEEWNKDIIDKAHEWCVSNTKEVQLKFFFSGIVQKLNCQPIDILGDVLQKVKGFVNGRFVICGVDPVVSNLLHQTMYSLYNRFEWTDGVIPVILFVSFISGRSRQMEQWRGWAQFAQRCNRDELKSEIPKEAFEWHHHRSEDLESYKNFRRAIKTWKELATILIRSKDWTFLSTLTIDLYTLSQSAYITTLHCEKLLKCLVDQPEFHPETFKNYEFDCMWIVPHIIAARIVDKENLVETCKKNDFPYTGVLSYYTESPGMEDNFKIRSHSQTDVEYIQYWFKQLIEKKVN